MSARAAIAEHPLAEPTREPPPPPSRPTAGPLPPGVTAAGTLALAGVLSFVTFMAGGGLRLGPMTTVEMALTIAAGAIVAGTVLLAPVNTPAYGLWSVGLLLALTALTGLSVVWSVAPDSSWQDAGRMLAYSGVFVAAASLARAAPGGWRVLLGGIVLAAVVATGYALLTKVLPNHLDATDIYARLQAPYGYWNAIGLTAAMGAIGSLWLGSRRSGHALLSTLAYPAMGLMLVTLMLAYSRGALIVFAVGVAVWLSIVPLRLRSVRVLLVGALFAVPVVAWDFSRHALSSDSVALATRTTAGHQLGVLLVAMLLALSLVGVAIGFFADRRTRPAAVRRRVGTALIALLALAVIAMAGALAVSRRGLTGTISHDVSTVTNPNAPVPPNTPGRLTAIGSVRARYWNEALKIFQAHPALGAGAAGYETARLRYRTETLDVRHAHGYIVQTLADLGIVGLAITLALLAAWMAAAGRSTHPLNLRLHLRRSRWTPRRSPPRIRWSRAEEAYTPERIGMLAMGCLVVVFGVHSFADWTWYVPGDAVVGLLCAGWLAGRGPLSAGSPVGPSRAFGAPRFDRRSIGIASAVMVLVLIAAWTQWQPQRSAEASERALALVARNPTAAREAAQTAVKRDPLSAQALFTLSAVERATGEGALARATLVRAVKLQPSNPQTWLMLGQYDMGIDPQTAVGELRAAVYLDPESILDQNAYVEALRANAAIALARRTATHAREQAARKRPRHPAQKRLRRALASRTSRASGKPAAP